VFVFREVLAFCFSGKCPSSVPPGAEHPGVLDPKPSFLADAQCLTPWGKFFFRFLPMVSVLAGFVFPRGGLSNPPPLVRVVYPVFLFISGVFPPPPPAPASFLASSTSWPAGRVSCYSPVSFSGSRPPAFIPNRRGLFFFLF